MSDYRQMLVDTVERSLVSILEPATLEIVSRKLLQTLNEFEISKRCTDVVVYDDQNQRILKRYLACLMVDGKSEKTISLYGSQLKKFIEFIQRNVTEIGTYDIRYYLACEKERGVSNRTLENTRSYLSAFFQWMAAEEIIDKNPCARIKPIKYPDEIRKAFSETEIDMLRSGCRRTKERALVEFLLSSGVRVSELASMDITDIDFRSLTVHVKHGKGAKERSTYINDVATMHLKMYLNERSEEGTALFYNKNHVRISTNGIRMILNGIAGRAGVENVHPHRFRRTFATGLANRGMSIQEIQKLLGHSNINTTLEYVSVDENKIKASYKQYIA